MVDLLTGTSEETAICWWLASQGFIWPEITEMSDEEYASYDYDGSGDSGRMIMSFLVRAKKADVSGWTKLSDGEKDYFRKKALDPYERTASRKRAAFIRENYEPVQKLIKCRGRKDHYRTVWRKKRVN